MGFNDVLVRSPLGIYGDLSSQLPHRIFNFDFSYSLQERELIATLAGGSSSIIDGELVVSSPGLMPSMFAIMRSRRAVGPHLGKGVSIQFAAKFTSPGIGNANQLVGVGDDDTGLFFGFIGESFGIVIRKSGISTQKFIPRGNFNSDKLDLKGDSGMFIQLTKGNVYRIEYQFDGYGQASFFVLNPATNRFVLVHREQGSSIVESIVLPRPYIPLSIETYNNAGSDTVSIQVPSIGAYIVDDVPLNGVIERVRTLQDFCTAFVALPVVPTPAIPIATVKNETTFSGLPNKLPTLVNKIQIVLIGVPATGDIAIITLIRNGLLVAPSFVPPPSDSHVSYDTAASAVSGGIEEYVFHAADHGLAISVQKEFDIPEIYLAPGETLTVAGNSKFFALTACVGIVSREIV